MAEKRARKAAEEAKEAKANELIRRKAGKVRLKTGPYPPPNNQLWLTHIEQETAQMKEDLKNKQILKDLEAKRRGPSHSSSSSLTPSLTYSETPSVCAIVTPYSYRKGERQEGPRCDQGADRSRQARTHAKGSAGKGPPRGWHNLRCHYFRSRTCRSCGRPSGVFNRRT